MRKRQKLYFSMMFKNALLSALLLAGVCFFSGCSADSPEIISLEQNTEFIRNLEGSISSSLHFTILVNEPQGKDDILKIDVYGPESLFWDFSFKTLNFGDEEKLADQLTIHIPKLAPPPGEVMLPHGTYTVIIHDISSKSASAEYRFSGISSLRETADRFPDIRFISKGNRERTSQTERDAETPQYSQYSAKVSSIPAVLTVTDKEGAVIESAELEKSSFDIDFNSLNAISILLSKVKMGNKLFLSSENEAYGHVYTQEIDVRQIQDLKN